MILSFKAITTVALFPFLTLSQQAQPGDISPGVLPEVVSIDAISVTLTSLIVRSGAS
jgi:hypothetical protein